jgi:homogentisate 1,2-dioxygenase
MTYYRRVGEVPRKRHSQFRGPDGNLYIEELVGEQGFFHASSLLYHRNMPNTLLAVESVDVPSLTPLGAPNVPLMPRMMQTHELPVGGDAVTGRQTLLLNDDLQVSYVVADRPSPLFRNAIGDELVFVEAGTAMLETLYGLLEVRLGDYVRVPMGCIHRWVPTGGPPARLLIMQATGHITLPNRYLSPRGQLLETAPYHERDFRGPTEPYTVEDGETEVLVRHRDGVTKHTLAHHPFDVIGWDGCIYPVAFSIHDFEPIVKRFHAPPPVHETFTGPGWVVCSFCPRPADFDPTSIPAPYPHSAIDCDEMMFFVSGDYTIRKGTAVGEGSITFHPAGWVHGPHPGGTEASIGKPYHEEYAVMIDTFKPLSLGPAAAGIADPDYFLSWANHSSLAAGR